MVIYIWKEVDSMNVFNESINLTKLIRNDISNIKYIFLPVDEYSSLLKTDNSLMINTGSSMESNFFLVRVATIFYPFALGKYLLVSFGYCLVSIIGIFRLYIVFLKLYPKAFAGATVSILFLPSVLLFASPIFKETLCIALFGFIASACYDMYTGKKKLSGILQIILCITFITIVKSYITYAIILSIFFVLLTNFLGNLFRKSIIGKVAFFSLIALIAIALNYLSGYTDAMIVSFIDTANMLQELYNGEGSSSASFHNGEIPSNMPSLIASMPRAFYTTFFRPHLWEARSIVVLFNAVESSALMLFFIYTVATKFRFIGPLFRKDNLAKFLLFFVIILGVLIGLTTFNFGTLIRYKTICVSFFWFLIFLLKQYNPAIQVAAGKK